MLGSREDYNPRSKEGKNWKRRQDDWISQAKYYDLLLFFSAADWFKKILLDLLHHNGESINIHISLF